MVCIQCESKNRLQLTFDHNCGKCRPIYKILLLQDCWQNFVHIIIRILHLTLTVFLHCLVRLDNCNCWNTDFNDILHVRPQNTSRKILGRLNSWGVNPVTIKSGKQRRSFLKRIYDVSVMKQWMIAMLHELQ